MILHNTESLVTSLAEMDGVEKISVETKVVVSVKKQNTGECDKSFQTIRERQIPEEELQELVEGTDWSYHGVIDAMSDFRVEDKFTKRQSMETGGE